MMRAVLLLIVLALAAVGPARAHDWYPPNCCSGHDCRPIDADGVLLTPGGFFVKESGELIPYDSPKIIKTPPEGGGQFHRCSRGGTADGATICLYIPNWGT